MRFSTSLLALALCCPICGATAPNDAAPPETAQFAFLVGEWNCETRFMNPAGEYSTGRATWTGRWILDGWAIQDDWVTQRPDGREFRGTNIHYPNPARADASPAPPPTPPGKIACPVLVLHGLDDTALMPAGFDGTWQWVDGDLTVVSIPGAAHFIQHEAEALVTDSIVAWLER